MSVRRVLLAPSASRSLHFSRRFHSSPACGFNLTMPSSGPARKRKILDAPISPPPLKRAVKSTTTKSAVASFFTPASKKPKDATTWTERGPHDDAPATLLVGKYQPEGAREEKDAQKRRKIAAFDLDSTLITTVSGKKFAREPTDWRWWDSRVPGRLHQLHRDEGYQIVILSNQGGIPLHVDPNSKTPKAQGTKRVGDFKQKCNAILADLNLPTTVYAATGKDIYRKPRTGMWRELCGDYGIPEEEVDLEGSFFVGDAGGRTASSGDTSAKAKAVSRDFSCSDRNFAHNVGIQYWTPEEFFLSQKPRDFAREFDLSHFPYEDAEQDTTEDGDRDKKLFEKKNDKDLVLFCGPPGAGKSTFYWTVLKPLGYERVNQDILKTRDRCLQAAKQLLEAGESVAVDNTNADIKTRAEWIDLAKQAGVSIRCVYFSTPIVVCEHNDAVRSYNKALNPESRQGLPKLAFTGFSSRFKEPRVEEGFEDVTQINFGFKGTKEEYGLWGRYWT